MSHHDHHDDEHAERAWELADKIGIAMFVTWDGERQRARPLAATVKRAEHAIYFLTDVRGQKDDQIEKFPIVTLAFADTHDNKYVTITGKATVSDNRAKIRDLWNPFAKAFFESADDPNIRVITVSPEDAEIWDSPHRVVATLSMLGAAVAGTKPAVGENAKVDRL